MKLRMPRPLTLFLVTVVVVVVGVGLQFGLPVYRQQRAVRAIEQLEGSIEAARPFGPGWLRRLVGEERLKPLDWVTEPPLP